MCVETCVADKSGQGLLINDIKEIEMAETEGFEPSIPLWGMLI